MALKLPGLKAFSGIDAKSRIFLLFAAVVGISLLVYIAVRFLGGGPGIAKSSVRGAPTNLVSIPGGTVTPEYERTVQEANAQNIAQAQAGVSSGQVGTAAVPTVLNVSGNEAGCYMCPSEETPNMANEINALMEAGKLSKEDGDLLKNLATNAVSVDEYAATLDALVKAGKLTPEQARSLLEKYQKQHTNALTNDSARTMDALIKAGRLPLSVANELLELQKRNLTPAEYAAELERLVREGKISPETAAQLLAQYTQQKAKEAAKQGAYAIRQMARSGQITPEVEKTLLTMQDQNVPLDQYAAAINRMVAEGKITPAVAAKLISQYQAQRTGAAASGLIGVVNAKQNAIAALKQMTASGEITPEVAKTLEVMQNNNVPLDEYAGTLSRLVAEGKLSPAAAAKLLEQYKGVRAALAASGPLGAAMVAKENAVLALRQLAASGQIPPDAAKILEDLQNKNVSADEYAAALQNLVAAGKIKPDVAAKLLAQYKSVRGAIAAAGPLGALITKGGASAELAKRLLNLQANNASAANYADELKRAVQAGLLTPAEAATLLQEYQAMISPLPGLAPTVEGSIPSAAFLELQERVRAGTAPPPATTAQFENITTIQQAPPQGATPQDRQKKLQQLLAAMGAQANSLINNAWQTTSMVHREGSPPPIKKPDVITTTTTTGGTGPGGTAETKQVLIKAGTIYFAVLDTAVDSDYPDTPVMATIIEGKHKNAKLLGKLSLAQGQDKVSLSFNLMDEQDWISAKAVTAFAIDPDTARTVMANDVDHHYLERYGFMFATSFIQGYSSAVTNAGTSTTGIFGTSSTHPALNPGSKFAVALGQIGTNLGAVAQERINMPATVKVNAGVGLGILFSAEVTE